MPFVLAQLSDPHIGGTWGFDDPVTGLRAAVDAVLRLRPRPDAVVVTGDLAEHASDEEYEQVKRLLAPLSTPTYVLPGNHDDRAALRRHFDLPGADAELVDYAVDLGPLRLLALDTIRPGADDGTIGAGTLEWLDGELARAPDAPTIIALHHPPLITGVPALDAFGIPVIERRALAQVLKRHAQVQRIIGGHLHRSMTGELGDRAVFAAPSTYVQARLDFELQEMELTHEPPGFAIHALVHGELVSNVMTAECRAT